MLNDKERAGSDENSPFLYVRSAGKVTITTRRAATITSTAGIMTRMLACISTRTIRKT